MCRGIENAPGEVSSDAKQPLDGRKPDKKNNIEVNGGKLLLTDICLAMRYDPLGVVRGLVEVVTCVYGPAVSFSIPDP